MSRSPSSAGPLSYSHHMTDMLEGNASPYAFNFMLDFIGSLYKGITPDFGSHLSSDVRQYGLLFSVNLRCPELEGFT